MNQLSIQEFYKGKTAFVTGATGFIGKILVEKLLWSCPDIKNVYIIIRSKKGKTIQERYDSFINSPPFDRIRAKNPEYLKKIVALEGDTTMENLGLSNEDIEKFYENVNVIFHLAASIRMDESIKVAIKNNTMSTKRLIEMSRNIKNFDSFIHVSTAFSNWNREEVKEVPYLPPYDPNDIIKMAQSIPDSVEKKLEPILMESLGGRLPLPNTYTYSKYHAEAIVAKEGEGIPRAILRPSIVISTLQEPIPGWVDNWGGSAERVAQISNGIVHLLESDPKIPIDLIPADMVINQAIVLGWKIALEKPKDVKVYNSATSIGNPINFEKFTAKVVEFARKYPYKNVLWYPWSKVANDRISTFVYPLVFHKIPAILIDTVLRIRGQEPKMIKHHQFAIRNFNFIKPFTSSVSKFYVDNTIELSNSLSKKDQKEFPFDVRKINWNECMETYVLGVKKYLLKENCSEEAIRKGQQKMKRLKNLHYGVKYALIAGSILAVAKPLVTKYKEQKKAKLEN